MDDWDAVAPTVADVEADDYRDPDDDDATDEEIAAREARDEWLTWRRRGIGGSDIGALLGLSNWASPWSLWADKVGLLPPDETTQRQRIGLRMEAVLAAEFHDETGLYVVGEQTWCAHREHPQFLCTVDGFVAEHGPLEDWNGSLAQLREIRSRPLDTSALLGTVQFKTDARYSWPDDEPPPAIRAQCIWEMGVTGLEHCWLVVMFGGFRVRTFEIDWDGDARADWELMTERAERFWRNHVLTRIPPMVDGSDATAAALRTIYPDHVEGETVDLDDLAPTLRERDELKDIAKRAKARLDEIDNEIRAVFGNAEVGLVGGVPALTYRTSERAAYTVAASTVRTLRKAPKPKTRSTT